MKAMTACLVAAAFTAAPAFAQTGDRPTATGAGSTTSGPPSMRPGTASDQTATSPANPTTSTIAPPAATSAPPTASPTTSAGTSSGGMPPSTTSSSGTSGSFIARQEQGQMLASRLIGTTVVSQKNETIGDVNDILFDRNGQVTAAVIGVGGFLGIGEKDVAVPFGQMEFVAETAATAAPAGGTAPNTSGTNAGSVPATTGATNAPAAVANAVPSRVMLKMSKADLQAAPTFEQLDRTVTTTPAGAGATGTTSVPRQ